MPPLRSSSSVFVLIVLASLVGSCSGCDEDPIGGPDAGDGDAGDGDAGDGDASDAGDSTDATVPDAAPPNQQPTIVESRIRVRREPTTEFVLTPVDAEGDPFTVSMRRCWGTNYGGEIEVCRTSACTETIELECGTFDDPASPVVLLDVERPIHLRFHAPAGLPAEVGDSVGFFHLPLVLEDEASTEPARQVRIDFDAPVENTPPEIWQANVPLGHPAPVYQLEAFLSSYEPHLEAVDAGYSFLSQGRIRMVAEVEGATFDLTTGYVAELAACADTFTPTRIDATCHPVVVNAALLTLRVLRPTLGPNGGATAHVSLFVDDLGYSGPCAEGYGPPVSPCPLTDSGELVVEWVPVPH